MVFVDVDVAVFKNAFMTTQTMVMEMKMNIANDPLDTFSGTRYFAMDRLPLLLLGAMRSLLSLVEFCGVVTLDLRCFIDDVIVWDTASLVFSSTLVMSYSISSLTEHGKK